jgi:hypothetical protein
MIERLNEFIRSQGLTTIEFERKISASDGVIRKSIRNNTDIQSKWLVKIAENYPILDMNWLLTGEGSMYRSPTVMNEAPPPDRDEVVRLLREKVADQQKIIDLLEEKVDALIAGGSDGTEIASAAG